MNETTKKIEQISFHHAKAKAALLQDMIITFVFIAILVLIAHLVEKVPEYIIAIGVTLASFFTFGIFNHLIKIRLSEDGYEMKWNFFKHWLNKSYYDERISVYDKELSKLGISNSLLDNLIFHFSLKGNTPKIFFEVRFNMVLLVVLVPNETFL